MFRLSARTNWLKPSATLAFQEKLRSLKSSGVDIIYLNAGEPDCDIPMNVKAQAIEAIHEGRNKYSDVRGIPELIEAICHEYKEARSLEYNPSQVIVSNGAKHALFNAFLSLLDPGDEVIIQAPFWPSYYDMIVVMGATPVIVHTSIENNFVMTAEQLEQSITPKTRLVIFNSPSNPTGQIISRKQYMAYAEVLRRHPDILIVSDDVYEMIHWDPTLTHFLQVAPDMVDRTVIVSSVSKSFAMTGWRLGYALGPEHLIQAMVDYQSQSTSNVCNIAQYAAVEALTGDRYSLSGMLLAYKQRHDLMFNMLSSSSAIKVIRSHGAFYLFPEISGVLERLDLPDAEALSIYCLEKIHVGIMPGNAFGSPNYMRFSYANKYEKLEEGLHRFMGLIGG